MPYITGLATTAVLSDDEKKISSISDYNKFASDIFDGMINKNKLVNQPGLNEKIKILAAKDEIKTAATKAELIAEQVQIKNFKRLSQVLLLVKVTLAMMNHKFT